MLRIDEKRLLGALDELAGIGAIDGGGCARLALTDEDKAGRDLVVGWMKAAGLDVRIDAIGNVIGVRAGTVKSRLSRALERLRAELGEDARG